MGAFQVPLGEVGGRPFSLSTTIHLRRDLDQLTTTDATGFSIASRFASYVTAHFAADERAGCVGKEVAAHARLATGAGVVAEDQHVAAHLPVDAEALHPDADVSADATVPRDGLGACPEGAFDFAADPDR